MCSTGLQSMNYSPRATFLPVIVGTVLIITINILTGISRFG
jgi:hypothetical protein